MGQPHWDKRTSCRGTEAGGWSRLRGRRRAGGLGLQGSGREGPGMRMGQPAQQWLP